MQALQRITAVALIAIYGIAWMKSSFSPWKGFAFVALASSVATLPYFMLVFFKQLLIGIIASVIIILLGLLCAPLGAIVALGLLMFKLGRIARNLPLVFMGILLYAILLLLPATIKSSDLYSKLEHLSVPLAKLAMAMLGTAILVSLMHLFGQNGYKRSNSAILMLAFTSYLLMVLALFAMPGDADVEGDFGGDADST